MRKKDYFLIAKVIEDMATEALDDKDYQEYQYHLMRDLAERLASTFELNGYKFDRQKFLTACGIETNGTTLVFTD